MRLMAFALALATALPVLAHEGHAPDVRPGALPVVSGAIATDAPRRLTDGRVRVAKASQRLWGLRTRTARQEDAAPVVELAGRVVADPSAGGRIQAPFAGTVEAGPGGLPLPGQAVRGGQVLAWLRPSLPPLERSARVAEQADVGARLAVARQRAERLAQLEGSVARKDIEAARAEADGLARQWAALGSALEDRTPLRAPAAGLLASALASVGQRVEAGTELFQVIRPDRLMVEALAYDPSLADGLAAARGEAGGVALSLHFAGGGRSLREGAVPLLFRVEGRPPVAVGQPVKVLASRPGTGKAVVLPLAAVSGSGDNALVWVHEAPELFAPRRVRLRPLDAERVAVREGLAAGERVVVQGAHLLGNVR
ncbi:HlyD family efflux transporter periplasmic adaptor subunit [Zoogloea sp.]|uniref:efflux RND transporter periplasmic adaptor subunit n=1 Tax=Zoogloea sp. TaxID=49181 RepID=UPI002609B986|nr:HlyD family efflux transporter periplasmic adaptor subunit [Zoogloea sp.]MDD3352179.1 HlyD family efflux transporter periplasmic adaptor subunit [Zoogloea sp.]